MPWCVDAVTLDADARADDPGKPHSRLDSNPGALAACGPGNNTIYGLYDPKAFGVVRKID